MPLWVLLLGVLLLLAAGAQEQDEDESDELVDDTWHDWLERTQAEHPYIPDESDLAEHEYIPSESDP